MDEIIHQITVLAEELANDYLTHTDPVARLYSIMLSINSDIGKRMKEIRSDK